MIDLKGQQFGRWEVVKESGRDKFGTVLWLCRCVCGNTGLIRQRTLRKGLSISCGCYRHELLLARNTKHGQKKRRKTTPEYWAWKGMMTRCYNPKNKDYENWGGRGVVVHKPWHEAKVFLEYVAKHLGPRPTPKHSLDRWPDINGNYAPGNIQWSTKSEQVLHQRKRKGCSSQYRGVTRYKQKWIAWVTVSGKQKSVGYFLSELEAALARDAAVLRYKTGAILNFPPKKSSKAVTKVAVAA